MGEETTKYFEKYLEDEWVENEQKQIRQSENI